MQENAREAGGDTFRVCSTCRTPIAFEASYFRCSVSTCNRPRTALYFCSIPCWDAHVPEQRHRDAWAEPVTAPTRAEWEAELARAAESSSRAPRAREQAPAESASADRREAAMSEESPNRKIVSPPAGETAPREILVVVSKLKAYIRARSGFNTSDATAEVL